MLDKFLDKIVKILFRESAEFPQELTNQSLVNQVDAAFKEVMIRESFDDRLIYDCSFLIIMRKEDYERIEMRLPFIVKGLVSRFYKVINGRDAKFRHYKPLADYWCFEFVPQGAADGEHAIGRGRVKVVSTATSVKEDWGDFLEGILTSSQPIAISINGKHSKYSRFNLNMNTARGVDIIDKGKMRVRFNPGLIYKEDDLETGEEIRKSTALARLSFEDNKKKTRMSYNMVSKLITVGQANAAGEMSTTTRLNINEKDSLARDHFQIKYDENTHIFYIALFADARVNEEKLGVSIDEKSPDWHRLKQKSRILCGLFLIEFEALK